MLFLFAPPACFPRRYALGGNDWVSVLGLQAMVEVNLASRRIASRMHAVENVSDHFAGSLFV
jgi:hypothetical protein